MRFFTALLCLPVFWALHFSHQQLIQVLPLKEKVNDSVRLPPAEFLQLTTLGHDELAADIMWLQLIQYYGAAVQQEAELEHIYTYFDLLTTLSPHFENAYVLSAYLMAEEPEKVQQILEKGMQLNPDNGQIFFQAGFNAYLRLKDNAQAAQYFEQASEKPGAPANTARIAAELYAKSDKQSLCSVSLTLLDRARQEAPDEGTKARAERQYNERLSLCELNLMTEKIQTYQTLAKKHYKAPEVKAGEKAPPPPSFLPKTLGELTKAGLLPEQITSRNDAPQPLDPLGRPYLYQAGKVKIQPFPWGSPEETDLNAYMAP